MPKKIQKKKKFILDDMREHVFKPYVSFDREVATRHENSQKCDDVKAKTLSVLASLLVGDVVGYFSC